MTEIPTPTVRPELRVFREDEIRDAVDDEAAIRSARTAFTELARGGAVVPTPLGMVVPHVGGEVHVKGAALASRPVFAFKVATGFYGNAALGLPSGSGIVLVFDGRTGFPLAVLADNGYLTDVRTAAAGAVAASHLTPDRPLTLALVGAGVQARLQSRLIGCVRTVEAVRVWSRSEASRAACAADVARTLGVQATPCERLDEAVRGADLVVTVTPSREPLVTRTMVRRGSTVIAVGSDGPDKRELEPTVVAGADKLVTDLTAQCARLGELHHAVTAGLMTEADVHAELGRIVVGDAPGRERDDETIVCDLTGVGVQDAAIAAEAHRILAGAGSG